MSFVIQVIVDGLSLGSFYALAALITFSFQRLDIQVPADSKSIAAKVTLPMALSSMLLSTKKVAAETATLSKLKSFREVP